MIWNWLKEKSPLLRGLVIRELMDEHLDHPLPMSIRNFPPFCTLIINYASNFNYQEVQRNLVMSSPQYPINQGFC